MKLRKAAGLAFAGVGLQENVRSFGTKFAVGPVPCPAAVYLLINDVNASDLIAACLETSVLVPVPAQALLTTKQLLRRC